jgi:hypothetical protein
LQLLIADSAASKRLDQFTSPARTKPARPVLSVRKPKETKSR